MVLGRRFGKKTGPKPGFDRDDVARAALAVGIDRFTLAQVASELGVATSSLYRVTASRDEAVEAALDLSLRDLQWPDKNLPWQVQLRAIVEMVWELCDRYPGYASALYGFPGAHAVVMREIVEVIESFVSQGMSKELAELAYDFALETAFSTHQSVDAMRTVHSDGRSGMEIANERVRRRVPDTQVFSSNPAWMGRGYLDQKIDLIIFAIEHRLAMESQDVNR